jgi:hypothetical protein
MMRAKKIKGIKRHILVDTVGLLLHAMVHPADIQDRDGGVLLLSTLFGMYPFLKKLFADAGYQGTAVRQGGGADLARTLRRDRETIGPRERLCCAADALDR